MKHFRILSRLQAFKLYERRGECLARLREFHRALEDYDRALKGLAKASLPRYVPKYNLFTG